MIYFSQGTLENILTLAQTAARAGTVAPGAWMKVYQAIYDALTSTEIVELPDGPQIYITQLAGFDQGVLTWILGAMGVNGSTVAFRQGYRWRGG